MSEITVNFNYDNGDPSVGIPDGWEECYVTDGEATIFFRPSYTLPVAQWEVEDEQGDLVGEGLGTACLTRPWLFEPIEHKWNLMQAQEAVSEADMAVGGIESELSILRHEYGEDAVIAPQVNAEIAKWEQELTIARKELEETKAKLRELQS